MSGEHKPIFLDRVRAYAAGSGDMVTPFGPVSRPVMGSTQFGLLHIIKGAVPFVIDDDAIAKAMELRGEFLADPKTLLIDLALVPFKETWIEYNPSAKLGPLASPLTSQHYGHLIVRDDTEHGVSVLTFEAWRKHLLMQPYVVNWSTLANGIAPWRFLIDRGKSARLDDAKADTVRSQLLTGGTGKDKWLPSWKDRVGGDMINPHFKADGSAEYGLAVNDMGKAWATVLKENRSTVSLLMSILAMIAWCPCEVIERKPKGVFLHERKPRAYMDHRVVKLHIPIKVAYRYLKRAHAEIVRKRRHRVREHFRVYHAGTPKEKRVLIHEHMRGDASLGYVNQEYEVTT